MSLRARLLLLVGAVVVIAVAAVGLVARQATRVEFRRFLELENEAALGASIDLAAIADPIPSRFAEGGWAAVSDYLARELAEAGADQQAVVLSPESELLAASHPTLEGFQYRATPGGELAVTREPQSGRQEAFLLVAPAAAVGDAAGESLGTLYLVPLPGTSAPELGAAAPGHLFLGSVNRWLLGTVAAVGLLALALTFVITRRIVAPIGELTDAAGELAAGRLDRRVRSRRNDELGRLAAAFNAMAASIERQEELRRKMVSDTAHELRTPITNLRCQIEALEDGVVEPSPELTASLAEEVATLQRQVDDLQELALADAGRLALEIVEADLGAELQRAAEALRRARGEEARVEIAAAKALPPVAADPRRLQQILANLLENAADHSPSDAPIRIEAVPRGEFLEIAVEDRGPGIEPRHLERVFDRYYRTDASRQRRTGGAGLGLAIVRELVEAHGGRVWAESDTGRGTVFRFTLPRG